MLFHRVPAEAAGVDPVAAPATVNDAQVVKIPASIPNSGQAPQRIYVAAEGPAAAVTVELFVECEKKPEDFLNGRPPQADRVWRLVETIVGVAGEAVAGTHIPMPGNYYARVTAGNGAGVVLLLGVV
jgi:hypothetical protein